jgi:CRISPR/Cas system-associated protein Cas5 (RAMP superfamily)
MKKAVETTYLFVPATVVRIDAEFGKAKYDVQFHVKASNLKEVLERVGEWAQNRNDLEVDYGTLPPNKKLFKSRQMVVIDAKQCDCGSRQGACVTGMGGCMPDKQPEGESV